MNGRLVAVSDTQLYVVERGPADGLPVLALHGGPGLDHTTFGSFLDPLTDAYRLVLVDGREQGRSARGTDPAGWTLEQHARDVRDLAAALGAQRYAVLGHSFGAFVALQHAVAFPADAVATVVSSGVPSTSWLDVVEDGLALFEPLELREQVRSSWQREATVQTDAEVYQLLVDQLPWHFADPRDPRIDQLAQQLREMRGSAAVLRATSLEGGGLSIEVEDRLSEVPQPLLVLAGQSDRTCVPEASRVISERAPRAELHVFAHAGHMTYVEQPEEYIAVVRAFLDRVTG